MGNKSQDNNITPQIPSMGYPAIYRIRVQGRLGASWSDRMAGMTVTTAGGRGRVETTVLEGQLLDQAALTGVINTLSDLHFPLLSVECIESETE